MKKFILLYKGPVTPPDASHDASPAWFNKAGVRLVEVGSPMNNGFALYNNGTQGDSTTPLNGHSLIQAENRNDVMALVNDHPFLCLLMVNIA